MTAIANDMIPAEKQDFGPSDAELVKRIRRGKIDAFETLVARYQGLVCAVAFSGTGTRALSEEVAQETFLIAWRDRKLLKDPSKLRSWLCGIARNQSHAARRRVGKDGVALDSIDVDIPARQPLAVDALSEAEEEALLWRALKNMPVIYREPLVLFYREDQSVSDVAAGLGLREVTVRKRLSRGREYLKERVAAVVERGLAGGKPRKGFVAGVIAMMATRSSVGLAVTAGVANVAVVTFVGAAFVGALAVGMHATGTDDEVSYSDKTGPVLSSAYIASTSGSVATSRSGSSSITTIPRALKPRSKPSAPKKVAKLNPRPKLKKPVPRFVPPKRKPRLPPPAPVRPAPMVTPQPAALPVARAAGPLLGKIVRFRKVGSRVRIRINRGKNAGVAIGWKGAILDSRTGKPLAFFKIYRSRQRYSLAKVDLPFTDVARNPGVRLTSP